MRKLITFLILLIFLFSVRIYAATITGQFGVGNAAPQFVPVTGITNDASTTAVPTNEGTAVTFTATATDANGDQWYLLICGSAGVTNGVCNFNPICTATTTPVNSGVQSSCTHSTTGELSESYSWFAYACDKIGSPSCTADANANSPYYVNHRPYASSISVTPSTVYETSTLTCSYQFNDDDDAAPADTESGTVFQWWKVGTPDTQIAGQTTSTLTGASFNKGDVIYCKVLVRDNHGLTDSTYRTSNNQITILNSPPVITAGTFAVQDGSSSWDSVSVIDTHDSTPQMRWTVTDDDPGDTIKTKVCISETDLHNCGKVDYNPGCPGSASGTNVQYQVVPTLPFTPITGSGISTNTYNVDLIPYDCDEVTEISTGTTIATSFALINNGPNIPIGLSPTLTHLQRPTLTWTATDSDTADTTDHWPADALTYHITIGDTCELNNYVTDPAKTDAASIDSFDYQNDLGWGTATINGGSVIKNVCALIWTTDGSNGQNSNGLGITTYDDAPIISTVKLGDNIGGATDCIKSTPCIVDPVTKTYASVGISVTLNDTDGDCGASVNTLRLTLCLSNSNCTETTTPRYGPFTLTYSSGSGTSCVYQTSLSSGTPEFFKSPSVAPDNYISYVYTKSQAAYREGTPNWKYNSLPAPTYPDGGEYGYIRLGDDPDIELDSWNPGLNLYSITNHGNVALTLNWKATDPSSDATTCPSGHTSTCWDLNTADGHYLQVDDDANAGEGTETGLTPLNIPDAANNPSGAAYPVGDTLKVCSSIECSSGLGENVTTRFHIKPPLNLLAGLYSSTITINPI